MRHQATDARMQDVAPIKRPGERVVLGARDITEFLAAPFYADGARIVRIVGFAHKIQTVTHLQCIPDPMTGVMPEAGKRRVLNQQAGMLGHRPPRSDACDGDDDEEGSECSDHRRGLSLILECILDPFNACAILCRHEHHIEPARTRMFSREIVPRCMQDAALLVVVDAGTRTAKVLAVANTYFNKDERHTIVRDEIDFASAAAEIPFDDAKFVRFEESRRERLARSASLGTRGPRIFRCPRVAQALYPPHNAARHVFN